MAAIIMPMGHVSGSDSTAHKIACENMFKLYDAKTASVSQMQEYAGCVCFVYPKHDSVGMKAGVACLLIAMLVGGFVGVAKRNEWLFDGKAESAFMGALGGLLLAMATGLIILAIAFVVS